MADLLTELNKYIKTLKSRGSAFVYEGWSTHVSSPFSIFILTFMGVIVSSRKSRGGTGAQIALGFALSFVFILFSWCSAPSRKQVRYLRLFRYGFGYYLWRHIRCYVPVCSAINGYYIRLLQTSFPGFLWGFTAILGKLVSIPAVEMVFYRTLLAAIGMGVVIVILRGSFKVDTSDLIKMLLTGVIVASSLANVFLYPAEFPIHQPASLGSPHVHCGRLSLSRWLKNKIQGVEVGLGLVVILGLYLIFFVWLSISDGIVSWHPVRD